MIRDTNLVYNITYVCTWRYYRAHDHFSLADEVIQKDLGAHLHDRHQIFASDPTSKVKNIIGNGFNRNTPSKDMQAFRGEYLTDTHTNACVSNVYMCIWSGITAF